MSESIEEAKRAIEFAKAKMPNLTTWGIGILETIEQRQHWKNSGPEFDRARKSFHPKNIATAVAFLRQCRKVKKFTYSSYHLKHQAERWGRYNGLEPYVANSELIVAAVYLGFPIRVHRRSLNVLIAVSKRDLEAVMAHVDQQEGAQGQIRSTSSRAAK
jgi:hypothetical protein